VNTDTLEVSVVDRVATVWLAREKVRNAFNETLIADLTNTFGALGSDPQVRVVVLAARGPAFCAGADLDWMKRMAGYSEADNVADAGKLAAMLKTIDDCPKPVVARVHGDAYAGGVGLVAVCDIAVAAEGVTFCLSETRLGLIPATIGPYVIRAMGVNAARRYLMSAEKFDAAEAHRIGLVHERVQASELDGCVNRISAALLDTSANAVAEAKRLVRDVANRPIDDALIADTARRIASIRASDDGREGVHAFLGKRKPRWMTEAPVAADPKKDASATP
jgi:methylglutaconyl-CoA hydratase